jgi:hypothetical protein
VVKSKHQHRLLKRLRFPDKQWVWFIERRTRGGWFFKYDWYEVHGSETISEKDAQEAFILLSTNDGSTIIATQP